MIKRRIILTENPIAKFQNPAGPITQFYNKNTKNAYQGPVTRYWKNKGGFGRGRTGGGGATVTLNNNQARKQALDGDTKNF